MSVEVFLYSESVRVISRRSLRRELESRGWHLLFMPDWRELKSKSDGVCGDDFIIGCKSAVQLSKIRELIRLKDPLALDSLLAKKEYATCSLGVCYPYEFSRYVRDHEIGELIGAIGEDAVQAMQRASRSTLFGCTASKTTFLVICSTPSGDPWASCEAA